MKRCTLVIPVVLCSFVTSPSNGFSQTPPVTASPAKPPTAAASPAGQTSPAGGTGLTPRGPEATAQQDPNRVVATVGGKPVTAKQALDMLQAIQPEDRKRYENKLSQLLQQIYMEDATATEAVRLKLDQQSPWKEQLRISRANILTQAYLSQATSASGSSEDPKVYYDAHTSDYDQVKLSGILVSFNPPGTPANAAGVQRTEADAQAKATEIEKKIKAGGDFSALARTDSDNQQSSTRGGDLGSFVLADPSLPANVKDLVAKMQPAEVSEPFRIPGGFYIFKLESRTKLPFEQVRASIVQKQQSEKTQAMLKQQLDKYTIQVQDANFFASSGPSPVSRVPSLQRPAAAQPPPSK